MHFLLHLNVSVIFFYSLRSCEAPILQSAYTAVVEPVYKVHPISCQLYTGLNYMQYSSMGKMMLPFIDSDILHRGAFYDKLGGIYYSEPSLVFEGNNYKGM